MTSFDRTETWLPETLALHGRYRSAHPALRQGDRVLDWRALSAAIDAAALALMKAGLNRGDRVVVLGRTTVEMIVWQFGVLRAGGVVVAISTAVADAALLGMLDDAGVAMAVADAKQTARIEGLGTSRALVMIDGERMPPPAGDAPTVPDIEGEDGFLIMYSSGTTGQPKGIVLTHRSRMAYGSIMAGAVRACDRSVSLVTTPLCSNMSWTSLIYTLMEGGTVIVHPKFDAAAFVREVDEHRVTHALLVPTQVQRILDVPAAASSMASLEMICTTGSAMNPDLKARAIERFGGSLTEMYGMPEGFATIVTPRDMKAKSHTAGRPMRANDVRAIDDDGREVRAGDAGEIVAHSPMLMRGYNNDAQRTAEAIWIERGTRRKFIRSGDGGRIDEDGFVHLVGRKKDMIISGGQNIYAVDLEQVLGAHPEVRDAAVIGVSDPVWGETPVALVVPRGNHTISAEELRDWVNQRLGRHQRLSALEYRDDLPRNAGGKLMKAELRAAYPTRSP